MKYVKPRKLKILLVMLYGSGAMGIVVGHGILWNDPIFMMSLIGVLNICLGGFFGVIFLTQEPKSEQRRKKYGK